MVKIPFPCLNQLNMKFIMLINVKMPTAVDILHLGTGMMINTAYDSLKARKVPIFEHLSFYQQSNYMLSLNEHKLNFYNHIEGNLNDLRYINDVLMPHVLSFLRQMPTADPIFQDDSVRPQKAYIVDDFL